METYSDDSEGRICGQQVMGSFIMAMLLFVHHVLCRVFWWNMKSPRCLSLPTAQIWCPVTSSFSQNWSHLSKGRYFRLLMRFRKIWQGSWWRLGELCEVPRCPLWRGLRHLFLYVQYFLYLVSSSTDVSIFRITWLDSLWIDLIYLCSVFLVTVQIYFYF